MKAKRTIILIGMKSSGKTTVGKLLAQRLDLPFVDMDTEVERRHLEQKGESLRFREIFAKYGKDYFRDLEAEALRALATARRELPFVLATGGGLPLAKENQGLLRSLGVVVFLDVPQDVLLPRIVRRGIPAFFPYPEDPARSLAEILEVRRPIYGTLAQITIACGTTSAQSITRQIVSHLEKGVA